MAGRIDTSIERNVRRHLFRLIILLPLEFSRSRRNVEPNSSLNIRSHRAIPFSRTVYSFPRHLVCSWKYISLINREMERFDFPWVYICPHQAFILLSSWDRYRCKRINVDPVWFTFVPVSIRERIENKKRSRRSILGKIMPLVNRLDFDFRKRHVYNFYYILVYIWIEHPQIRVCVFITRPNSSGQELRKMDLNNSPRYFSYRRRYLLLQIQSRTRENSYWNTYVIPEKRKKKGWRDTLSPRTQYTHVPLILWNNCFIGSKGYRKSLDKSFALGKIVRGHATR